MWKQPREFERKEGRGGIVLPDAIRKRFLGEKGDSMGTSSCLWYLSLHQSIDVVVNEWMTKFPYMHRYVTLIFKYKGWDNMKQKEVVVRSTVWTWTLSGFESWCHYLPAKCPWLNSLASWYLSFLIS